MLIIINKRFPKEGFDAINICGIIFIKTKDVDLELINHERIHTAQMRELLYVFFYLWYVIEWLVKLIKYRDSRTAYMNIGFEKEAYRYSLDFSYLKRRKHFSFIKFITK